MNKFKLVLAMLSILIVGYVVGRYDGSKKEQEAIEREMAKSDERVKKLSEKYQKLENQLLHQY